MQQRGEAPTFGQQSGSGGGIHGSRNHAGSRRDPPWSGARSGHAPARCAAVKRHLLDLPWTQSARGKCHAKIRTSRLFRQLAQPAWDRSSCVHLASIGSRRIVTARLWTKADDVTSFDNLGIQPIPDPVTVVRDPQLDGTVPRGSEGGRAMTKMAQRMGLPVGRNDRDTHRPQLPKGLCSSNRGCLWEA